MGEDFFDGFAGGVFGDVEGSFFYFDVGVGGDAECVEDGGVEVGDGDGVLDGGAGALVGGDAVEVTFFGAAAEDEAGAGGGEVSVHAVEFLVVDDVGLSDLISDGLGGFAFDHHVAGEFGCENDECAVEEFGFFEVADKLCDGSVDLFFHGGHACVAVFVGVEAFEGDVFGGDFDESCACFGESFGEEAAASES